MSHGIVCFVCTHCNYLLSVMQVSRCFSGDIQERYCVLFVCTAKNIYTCVICQRRSFMSQNLVYLFICCLFILQ